MHRGMPSALDPGRELFPPNKVLVYLLPQRQGVEARLFVVPAQRLAKPLGLARGWGKRGKGMADPAKSARLGPSVTDFYRPFQGAQKLLAHETPQGLKKPPWQIRHEFLEEEKEKERQKRRQALREGRPIYRPGYSPENAKQSICEIQPRKDCLVSHTVNLVAPAAHQMALDDRPAAFSERIKTEGGPRIVSGDRQNVRATGKKVNFQSESGHLAPEFTPSTRDDSENFMDTSNWHATNFQHNDSAWANSTKSIGPSFAGQRGCGAVDANCDFRQSISRARTWQRFEDNGDNARSFERGNLFSSEYNQRNANCLESSGARGSGQYFRADEHPGRSAEFKNSSVTHSYSKSYEPHSQSSRVRRAGSHQVKKNHWNRASQVVDDQGWSTYEETARSSHPRGFDQNDLFYEGTLHPKQNRKNVHSNEHGSSRNCQMDLQREVSDKNMRQHGKTWVKMSSEPIEGWPDKRSGYVNSDSQMKNRTGTSHIDQVGKANRQAESSLGGMLQGPDGQTDSRRFQHNIDKPYGSPILQQNPYQCGRRSTACDKGERSLQEGDQRPLVLSRDQYAMPNRKSAHGRGRASSSESQMPSSRGRASAISKGKFQRNRHTQFHADEDNMFQRTHEGFGRHSGVQRHAGKKTFYNQRWSARDYSRHTEIDRDTQEPRMEKRNHECCRKLERELLETKAAIQEKGHNHIPSNEDWSWGRFDKQTSAHAPPSSSNGAKPYSEKMVLRGSSEFDKGPHSLKLVLYGGGNKNPGTRDVQNDQKGFDASPPSGGCDDAMNKPFISRESGSDVYTVEPCRCQASSSSRHKSQELRGDLPRQRSEVVKPHNLEIEPEVSDDGEQNIGLRRSVTMDCATEKSCAEEETLRTRPTVPNSERDPQAVFHSAWDGGIVQRRVIADIFARAVQEATEDDQSRKCNSSNSYDVNSRSDAGAQEQQSTQMRGIPHSRDKMCAPWDNSHEARSMQLVHVRNERGKGFVIKPKILSDSNSVPVRPRQKPRPDTDQ